MKHGIVYAEAGVYAGWPANHGAWQWGDEFLFGFLRGKYKRSDMHNIVEPYEKVQARSLDGGKTWAIEKPNVDFECVTPIRLLPFHLDRSIIRVCGVYDHGGEYCDERGGFYLSHDRGHEWRGPFLFDGIRFSGNEVCTARTCALRYEGNDLVFLSKGNSMIWGTDEVFCAVHDGRGFKYLSTVCADDGRAVMPSCARVGDRLVVAMRRRKTGQRAGWIDAYCSDDGAKTWRFLSFVGNTGASNGNPPALRALPDGRLCCVFGNRDDGSIVAAMSVDAGKTWTNQLVRTNDIDNVDIGYPQLFVRSDGVPVCVYYWIEAKIRHQHIATTAIDG